jgi:hypothetical protein
MTEEEWFAATDAAALVSTAERVTSPRKLRLFMVGVCRRGWDRYGIPAVQTMLGATERYADGEEVGIVVADLRKRTETGWFWGIPVGPLLCPVGQERAAVGAFLTAIANGSPPHTADTASREEWTRSENRARAKLLRGIVGNPWHPAELEREWLTSTVVLIAQQMYESRDFGAMPILADALQDAGCDSEDILTHCRDPHAVHVRGCWVVDLALGKE